MPHRRMYRVLILAISAALLLVSVRFGFADAWLDQYALPAMSQSEATPDPAGSGSLEASSGADSGADMPIAPKPVVLSNRVTEYHISVTLQDDGTLTGEQTVTWRNPGRKAVSDIYLHLYPNAFSPGSTFIKESGGQLRGDRMTPGSYGSMNLTALETEEGETLLPRLRYVQPDDGNTSDKTLASFRLPKPIQPGEKTTLVMKFTVKLPQVFARMGKAGDFVMAGQWFPKIAVYEPAGTRGRTAEGWNAHQYHGNSEFYSDFGIYSVKINVPAADKVAATGFQTRMPTVANGRKVYQFYADDVHDFGWSASPSFQYAVESFSSEGVPGVRVQLYLDPSQKNLKDRYLHAAKSALSLLGQWYGDYPYSTLSIVVPPADASGAGGMEYPTLVTAAAAKSASPGYELERTVVHEIAHQYWYGMVASNEFEEAWLDEGFTSYTEDKLMAAIYGVHSNNTVEASYLTDPEPLKLDSWRYNGSDGYAENVYLRGKLVLTAIEKRVGEKTMSKIMRAYFQKYRFKHPSTADFQKVVENVTREKWNDFFSAYVYRGQMSDFSVASVDSRPASGGGYVSNILLRRNGGSAEPVTVLFRFADGSTVTKTWNGVHDREQLQVKHPEPLLYVAVDPSQAVVLDNLRFNNYLKAEVPEKARTRLDIGLSKIIDGLIGTLAW
ncbi:M1 family metallopeptidase [Cohnella zeiphila]|uniref:M1 family metallopeptidase n=1 Tax=Cohnella zeiphila TaxID=2761120 RepID=A0A7X0VXM9_9BACL|nr:M1 family metallopeptidase [Cohnella zeiphila]MBB6733780.1 M1 family metallopeptidase [Cohnella zeiphila]